MVEDRHGKVLLYIGFPWWHDNNIPLSFNIFRKYWDYIFLRNGVNKFPEPDTLDSRKSI